MPIADLETFIAKWSSNGGGQERADDALLLPALCEMLDIPRRVTGKGLLEIEFQLVKDRPAGFAHPLSARGERDLEHIQEMLR